MTTNRSLRKILSSNELSYAMEAHNGISAKIAQEAGFFAIWASGLTISSSLGHRDCNEISWTNLCDQVGYIVDATSLPVLVDGDTGFGNFNNVRQLVVKLCKFGAAGVCLEDKNFPKTNSFLPYNQDLAPIEEFVGKIKAAKDSQLNEDFCLIARTEALIAEAGIDEALKRAYAYRDAGADAVLIHSKKATAVEIIQFCKSWDHSIPLILVPTTYDSEGSFTLYQKLGISLVIWANHFLRASIAAMQNIAKEIQQRKSIAAIHQEMASIQNIFTLVNVEELQTAESIYLPKRKKYYDCK